MEGRQLLASVSFANGVLTLTGDAGITNTITAFLTPDSTRVWGIADNTGRSIARAALQSIEVNSGSADDKISIDAHLTVPVTITGAAAPPSTPGTTSYAPPSSGSTTKLAGTPFGTAGSWANSGNTFDKVFDGNTYSFFDAPGGDWNYVGLDVGSPATISAIKFVPRSSGFSSRMIGGKFQGSNDGVNYTDFATISVANWPVEGSWNTINVNSTTAYRYVRYLSPSAGFGNIAELEFDGAATSSSSTTVTSVPPPSTMPATPPAAPTTTTTTTNASAASPQAVIHMVSTTSIVAGQTIDVHAMDSSLGVGTPLTARYEWNFGDANSKYNTLVGFNAAHVYDHPGNYTLTLKITNEAGNVSTASQQISVSPDSRRTIYVDAWSGSDWNSGLSPGQAIQSVAKARTMLADNTKILFARGETFPMSAGIVAAYNNVTIGAYGNGANPVLQWVGGLGLGNNMIAAGIYSKNITVENLTFDSVPQSDMLMPDAVLAAGNNVTVRNCTFLNLDTAVNANASPTGLLVQDNTAPLDTGLRAYLVWLQGTDSTILGNTDANSMRAHDIRAGFNYTRTLIAYNTLDNKDRTGVGDAWDINKATINLQWGSYAYVANNTLYDGGFGIGPLGTADEIVANPTGYMSERTSWVVAENNTINNTYVAFHHGAENVVARNNIVSFNDGLEDFNVEGYSAQFNRQVVNLSIVNNTGINTNSQGTFLRVWGPASGITLDNNLYVAPNLRTGPYTAGSVFLSGTDTSSFRQISHNVWQMPAVIESWTNGGVNMINGNYVSASTWNSLPNVSGDIFANTPIQANFAPVASSQAATAGMLLPTVSVDMYGKTRPTWGNSTAGAVQL